MPIINRNPENASDVKSGKKVCRSCLVDICNQVDEALQATEYELQQSVIDLHEEIASGESDLQPVLLGIFDTFYRNGPAGDSPICQAEVIQMGNTYKITVMGNLLESAQQEMGNIDSYETYMIASSDEPEFAFLKKMVGETEYHTIMLIHMSDLSHEVVLLGVDQTGVSISNISMDPINIKDCLCAFSFTVMCNQKTRPPIGQ